MESLHDNMRAIGFVALYPHAVSARTARVQGGPVISTQHESISTRVREVLSQCSTLINIVPVGQECGVQRRGLKQQLGSLRLTLDREWGRRLPRE